MTEELTEVVDDQPRYGHDIAKSFEHFYWTSGLGGTQENACGSGFIWKASGLTHYAEYVGRCPNGSANNYFIIRRWREGDPEWRPYDGWVEA